MTKLIPLTQGRFAQVDDDLFENLSAHKWHAFLRDGNFYAARKTMINGRKKTIFMHHAIIGKPPVGKVTDHIDRDGLNNQRHNLRHVSHSINALNTNQRGVFWCKAKRKWQAQITLNGNQIFLGRFEDIGDAIRARETAKQNYIWDSPPY